MVFELLINDILKKKELSGLSQIFVLGILEFYLQHEKPKLWKKRDWLNNVRSKEYKLVIKEVRKILRHVYGAFKTTQFSKRELLLKNLKRLDDLEMHVKLLKLHISTKERLPHYFEVYGNILEAVDKIESVLDLGAGMNPLSIPFMDFPPPMYYAAEIALEDVDFLNRYFKKMKIKGHAFTKDLTHVDNLPKVDVCFVFKLLETLEILKKNVSKELLEKIQAKWIVASFATKSIGGKKTISKDRLTWFKKLIKPYPYTTFEISNEIFFVIEKK